MNPTAEVFDGGAVLGRVEVGEEMAGDRGRPIPAPQQGKKQWSDSSKLLFQSGYIRVLKDLALSGQLQLYNIRSVCWRLFLGCLPEDEEKWVESVQKSRSHYDYLKKTHISDPYLASASLDITVNNPLSQAENSPWHQFFLDNELHQMIDQDVVRTFPDVQFFKQHEIQEMMQDILFCYAKETPDLVYRQGMHELLAPVIFVLHAEMRDVDNDPSLAPAMKVVMDPKFIEHDAYTIFSELMELTQSWYMFTSLEADHHRIRQFNSRSRGMRNDPRTQKPFSANDMLVPTSAIARKLDVIHHLLLKNADAELYHHLKVLSIPAQTYGIRWIRLLFGREFPLPSVLELWDALFADGPSLGLVDYMCVAMLMHIREVLIEGDYAVCMQHLMHFPTVYEVNYLVQRALHLRNPSVYPSPRLWAYHPSRELRIPPRRAVVPIPQSNPTVQSRASRAKQALTSTAKQLPRALARPKQTSPPPRDVISPPTVTPTPPPVQPSQPKPKGKGHVVADKPREMTNNPKSSPAPSTNELERLTNRLETLEAKCRYCGSKMESLLSTLEDEVTELPDLPPDAENSIFLAVAGLKQVRDLLLTKLTFSGELERSWERGRKEEERTTGNKQQDLPATTQTPVSTTTDNDDQVGQERTAEGAERTVYHPLLASDELPLGKAEDEWVHLSTTDTNVTV